MLFVCCCVGLCETITSPTFVQALLGRKEGKTAAEGKNNNEAKSGRKDTKQRAGEGKTSRGGRGGGRKTKTGSKNDSNPIPRLKDKERAKFEADIASIEAVAARCLVPTERIDCTAKLDENAPGGVLVALHDKDSTEVRSV